MKDKLTPFQMIFYGFLIFVIIAGVILFSIQRGNQEDVLPTVTMWGTVSSNIIDSLTEEINQVKRDSVDIVYSEYSEDMFEDQLIEAIASAQGPDLILVSDDLIIKHENKLYEINYDAYTQKDFKSNFIEASDILLTETGMIGLPYIADPIVLYWNRAMLNSAGISQSPRYWDQISNTVSRLTKVDSNLRIQKSAIAFGEFNNVNNAKNILTTLIRQSGNETVVRNSNPNVETNFEVVINNNEGYSVKPIEAAINYFTQFSNPSMSTYSWNRSLPNSREMFIANDLAFYVGYASEFLDIQNQNPNLNFDVSVLPQSRSTLQDNDVLGSSTGGKLTFLGIVRNSNNIQAAFQTANYITNAENIEILSSYTNLPPVRRDLLSSPNNNAILQTFYDSALIMKPFLDPDTSESDKIFSDMIENYTSGRMRLNEVIGIAENQLIKIIK